MMEIRSARLKFANSGRRDEVEGRILSSCEQLLEEKPFAQISIEDLAREAGIQRTAFYFYFANKQDVLARLVEQFHIDLYNEAQSWLAHAEATRENLERGIKSIVEIFATHRTLLRAAVEVATYTPEMRDFWHSLVYRFVDTAEQRIRQDQSEGRVQPHLDPRATAEAFVWMTERCCYQFLAVQQDRDPNELVHTLAQIWGLLLLRAYPDRHDTHVEKGT